MISTINSITLIADTHSQHNDLTIRQCDLLIVAGDYSRKNNEKNLIEFVQWLKIQPARYKILINGNHDRYYYRQPNRFTEILDCDIMFLENSNVMIEGVSIWGSPLTVPVIEGRYNQVERIIQERQKIWDAIPEETDIVITHSPPYGILDEVKPGENLGCKSLLKRILEIKPKYHLFGHIHQDYGECELDGIKFKNGALVNDNEQIVRNPIIFNYE